MRVKIVLPVYLRTTAVSSILLLVSLASASGQTFKPSDYGASGSASTATCSGQAGTTLLTGCATSTNDWKVGQGIRIVGGGPSFFSRAGFTTHITVTSTNPSTGGDYCYVAALVDPLQGISPPSAPYCTTSNSAAAGGVNNSLRAYTDAAPTGAVNWPPAATFLWYVSVGGQDYNLFAVQGAILVGQPTADSNPNITQDPNAGNIFSSVNDFGQALTPPAPVHPGAAATLASRGGWPTKLPFTTGLGTLSKNEDLFAEITAINGDQASIGPLSKVDPTSTYTDPPGNYTLATNISNAMIYHDDTQAVQTAINMASVSGGVVQLNAGTYRIWRPIFQVGMDPTYPVFTSDISQKPFYAGFGFLQIPNGSPGGVHILGVGEDATILQTPPDQADQATLLLVGAFTRPDDRDHGGPAIKIGPLHKGITQVSFPDGNPGLKPGDDVMLFTGNFGLPPSKPPALPCKLTPVPPPGTGFRANDCHFTELNTVASLNSLGGINLVYPASKNYQTDQLNSDFGLVKMQKTPHNISITDMSINTYDHITSSGLVFGLYMNALHINGYISGGAFSGGYKRDVTLRNSTWGVGRGEAGYSAEEEYDKFTNLMIINDAIYGFAPIWSAGPSQQARLYATEGTSQVTYYSNSFNYISLYFDETTDDYINHNNFFDSIIKVGNSYGQNPGAPLTFSYQLPSYLSFGSQAYASVTQNVLTVDSSYSVPWVINIGHFDAADIANNAIEYDSTNSIGVFYATSGILSNNTVNVPSSPGSSAFVTNPDIALVLSASGNMLPAGPWSSISVQNNIVKAPSLFADVSIPDPGSVDTVPICISAEQDNAKLFTSGQSIFIQNPNNVTISCH